DQAGLDRKGNDAIQLQLFWDYQFNLDGYPKFSVPQGRKPSSGICPMVSSICSTPATSLSKPTETRSPVTSAISWAGRKV
ncbi:MAG: hypothetical protein AB7E41_21635, partial [Mycolicibacterium sp.]